MNIYLTTSAMPYILSDEVVDKLHIKMDFTLMNFGPVLILQNKSMNSLYSITFDGSNKGMRPINFQGPPKLSFLFIIKNKSQ